MDAYPYELTGPIGSRACLGLVVLQTDETIEHDFRRLLPIDHVSLYVSRVPSGLEVSGETLKSMEAHLPAAAGLFPRAVEFDAVGYGCTSGTSVIGPGKIADLVSGGCVTKAVTEPVSALLAAAGALGVARMAFLSPYVEEVSATLRGVLAKGGLETVVFGSFDEAEEAKVARIAPHSLIDAAVRLGSSEQSDFIFLSCTNLRTLDVIGEIEARTGKPVLSSNQVLAWHMAQLSGAGALRLQAGTLTTLA
jgi:maleate isomerase